MLTRKQQRFVEEYLIDLNASQAAKRAGYSEKTSHTIGHENLNKPEIAAAIKDAMGARSARTQVTADRVIEELARVAFSQLSDFVEWGESGVKFKSSKELTQEQIACVAEVSETLGHNFKRRIKLHCKLSALEKLGRHLGLFDKSQSGESDLPIEKVVIELSDGETLEAAFPDFSGKPHEDLEDWH